jgi:hypothetical protein
MRKVIEKYKLHINRAYLKQIILAAVFLLISAIISYYSGLYSSKVASNPVSDIILSNIRVYDVSFFFIYGALLLWLFFATIVILDPKKIAFSLKAIALFVIIRSIFVIVTHIAPFPGGLVTTGISSFFDLFSGFPSDLFFSGHTGFPFLFALIFWDDKFLRYTMFLLSLFFGAVVLMGHLHYTIDVLAAFFITYSIYRLAEIFFKKDRIYFYHGSHNDHS